MPTIKVAGKSPLNIDHLGSWRFYPLRGVSYTLTLWDLYETDHFGKNRLAYRLTRCEAPPGTPRSKHPKSTVMFQGDDFYPSTMHATDSLETVLACIHSLTMGSAMDDVPSHLRPSIFECEALWLAVEDRLTAHNRREERAAKRAAAAAAAADRMTVPYAMPAVASNEVQ